MENEHFVFIQTNKWEVKPWQISIRLSIPAKSSTKEIPSLAQTIPERHLIQRDRNMSRYSKEIRKNKRITGATLNGVALSIGMINSLFLECYFSFVLTYVFSLKMASNRNKLRYLPITRILFAVSMTSLLILDR